MINKDLVKLHAEYVAAMGVSGREDAVFLTLAHVVWEMQNTIDALHRTMEEVASAYVESHEAFVESRT